MGLFTYTLAGGGFILIGAWESVVSSVEAQKSTSSLPAPPQQQNKKTTPSFSSSSSSITFFAISLLSFFFILNALISLSDALKLKDDTGLVIQLEMISISSLFFLYSVLGLMSHFKNSIFLPSSVLNFLYLFAFIEEFLLFYLQRKDPDGIENRYFDLFLLPIGICIFSTILELKTPKTRYSRLARGIGIISQGAWIIQMGFSFYSDAMAHGCSLHQKSRGNYTIRCKGHPEYHRGRAIATLQFNCQLALLVVLVTGVYSLVCRKSGIGSNFAEYKPIGAEMQQLDNQSHFTLDSDEEGGNAVEEEKGIVAVTEPGVNGYGYH